MPTFSKEDGRFLASTTGNQVIASSLRQLG